MENETMIKRYPEFIMKLDTIHGFISRYWENLSDINKSEKAYEATERQRGQYFDGRKYANFESFRRVLYRKFKKQNA